MLNVSAFISYHVFVTGVFAAFGCWIIAHIGPEYSNKVGAVIDNPQLETLQSIGCVEKLKNGLLNMPDSNFYGTLYRKYVWEVSESSDNF